VPYLIQLLLFLLPFGVYALWRRMNPTAEPGWATLVTALVGLAFALAGAIWFGQSRNIDRNSVYVPAHIEGDRIAPSHLEPRR
jgi:hypothetical protein